MSTLDSKGNSKESPKASSAGTDFEQGLSSAKDLIEKGDLDEALKELLSLEVRYVSGAILFDLLGEALLARGNIKEGVRYKTLYEVLRGTFKIVTEETTRERPDLSGIRPSLFRDPGVPDGHDLDINDFVPVTPAMGHEFVRQGHYARAVSVFQKLIERNPDDQSLREAKDLATKKETDKKLLGVFQRWLTNIEQMKADESSTS